MKRTFILAVVIILTGIALTLLFNVVVNGRPNFIQSCSEARARHITNIPESSVYYRPELDRNHDKIACET